jgi:hypothetical protein
MYQHSVSFSKNEIIKRQLIITMLDYLNLIVSRFVTFMLNDMTLILGFFMPILLHCISFNPVVKVDRVFDTVNILNIIKMLITNCPLSFVFHIWESIKSY